MNHDEIAQLDAAYVLGALDAADRSVFEDHLRSCQACARSVSRLQSMPRLLSHVDESVFVSGESPTPVPGTLLPGLLREVRRRRWRRRAIVAAAAAVVAVSGAGLAWQLGPDEAAAPQAGAPMVQVGQQHAVRASVALDDVAWGTRLELTCSYDPADEYDDPAGTSYSMLVQTRDGSWQQVATWRGVPGRTVTVTAATATPADDITSIEVRSLAGPVLLELDR